MQANEYDLVVIGSGPAGQKGAICAAKMRKKVAIIDRDRTIGGVCVHTGTIPSKMFREAVLYLSGLRSALSTDAATFSKTALRCPISSSAPNRLCRAKSK